MDLKGRSILVTGAAQGLGLGIAHALARAGARLALVDCNPLLMDEITDPSLSGCAVGLVKDLANSDAPFDVVGSAAEQLGPLNGLVNCAAWSFHRPFAETSISDFDRVVAINQRAPYFLTQAFA